MTERLKYIDFCIKDLDLNQNTTDNYLDKYIPFRIQNFISENLEVVLNNKQMHIFMEFEKRKYQHMHDKILKDEGKNQLNKNPQDLKYFEGDKMDNFSLPENNFEVTSSNKLSVDQAQPKIYLRTQTMMDSDIIKKKNVKINNIKKVQRLDSFINLKEEDSATLIKVNRKIASVKKDILSKEAILRNEADKK